MGGMFGESKYDVLQLVPDKYAAKTVLIAAGSNVTTVIDNMHKASLSFPVIFKPDIGERGYLVRRINRTEEIQDYLKQINGAFLVQEFVDLPVECGIFYTRFPNDSSGKVTSVVTKEMLSVVGDGKSTLQELILGKDRAKLQWEILKSRFKDQLDKVPEKSARVVLNEVGNHCLGTKFLNGEKLINERLSETFDHISKQIAGFYFGRYDLRARSIADLYDGNFKVMELNGCGAEPAHIYESGFPLTKALGVNFTHWRNLYIISQQNHKRGVNYMPLREGIRIYKEFKRAMN